MKNKFCCDLLTENIIEVGRKGFSIFPCKIENDDSYYFILQFRSLDYPLDNPGLTVSQRAIKYCPWCGTRLSDIVELNKREIEMIAHRTKHLII
jgi:hypothetical protein